MGGGRRESREGGSVWRGGGGAGGRGGRGRARGRAYVERIGQHKCPYSLDCRWHRDSLGEYAQIGK